MKEGVIRARDQGKVFVERAYARAISARDVESRYLMNRGKGNTYIEFDADETELETRINRLTGELEFVLHGNVELSGRNAQAFDNR